MILLQRGEPWEGRGLWRPCVLDDGSRQAIISCPECGGVSYLEHTIKPDGTVTPSVVHNPEDRDCEFHDHVKLEGWAP